MQIRFNDDRAREVFAALTEAWTAKQGVFKNVLLPQDRFERLPDDREMANWLFFAALTQRGGVMSENPMEFLWWMRTRMPELFHPQTLARDFDHAGVRARLRAGLKEFWDARRPDRVLQMDDRKGYKIEQIARGWHHNAVLLSERFDGDPRKIFADVDAFEEAFSRIDRRQGSQGKWGWDGIIGMRRKIFSLYTIWLQEKSIIPVFPTPIPVDFHALRVLWATEAIDVPGLSFEPWKSEHEVLRGFSAIRVRESLVDEVALWSGRFIPENGFSHLVINPALWTLSRELCVGQAQNAWTNHGSGPRTPELLRMNPGIVSHTYVDPCGQCPIESACSGAIPSGPYYRWGILLRLDRVRGLRGPQALLPGLSHIVQYRPPGRTHA